MFENNIMSVLVSVYGYWWYKIIEKSEQYMMSVYLEKYSLWTKAYDLYSAMWLLHRTGILWKKHFLLKLLPPNSSENLWCQVVRQLYYITNDIIFSFYLVNRETKWFFFILDRSVFSFISFKNATFLSPALDDILSPVAVWHKEKMDTLRVLQESSSQELIESFLLLCIIYLVQLCVGFLKWETRLSMPTINE